MTNNNEENIDAETIASIGLRPTNKHLNAQIALSARVFEYPHLENVYIMESDLYGNTMPKGSCFLAFNGQHGLIGKHLKIETLKRLSAIEMEKMVQDNNEG
ncbi:MAG TPA: hypothetical protein VEV62_03400 [Parafilimonas sp.]|jgi:hypothetical protein|nr:hypothetical protein [Parafilimonas sp.]